MFIRKNPPAGGGGAWEKVGEVIVTGSATDEMEITGLDLDADVRYKILWTIVGALGITNVLWRYNGVTTASMYRIQRLRQDATSVSGALISSNVISLIDPDDVAIGEMSISKVAGQLAKGMVHVNDDNVNGRQQILGVTFQNNSNNMTSFSLNVDGATDNFGVGSRLTILKLA